MKATRRRTRPLTARQKTPSPGKDSELPFFRKEADGPGFFDRSSNFFGARPQVHRSCADCEESDDKEALQRKRFESSLNDSKGQGSALPGPTKGFMENTFHRNFSNVRIHSGTPASIMSRQIHAKAFTHQQDIYFDEGQYAPETSEGKSLLAHELTHVVQQGNSQSGSLQKQDDEKELPAVQREEEDKAVESSGDAGTESGEKVFNDKDPEFVLVEFMSKLDAVAAQNATGTQDENTGDASGADPTEEDKQLEYELNEAKDWLGSGAQAFRKRLLIETELMRLDDGGYRQSVIDTYYAEEGGGPVYLDAVKANIDTQSSGEAETMNRLNVNIGLGLTPENFIDNWYIIGKNAADAFPQFSWEIVRPLITPADYIGQNITFGFSSSQKDYYASMNSLSVDMSYNGLPVSFIPSLSLSYYSLVKSKAAPSLIKMPQKAWMYDHFFSPEEVDLHSETMKKYVHALVAYADFSFRSAVYQEWIKAGIFKWQSFNAMSIHLFRKQYPSGFTKVDDFYQFAHKGAFSGLGIIGAAWLQDIYAGGRSPYLELSLLAQKARENGEKHFITFGTSAFNDFNTSLTNADYRIAGLGKNERLVEAITWSIEKGFAAQGITALLANLDTILMEILKDTIKDKAKRKAIMTGIGMAGPWGRAISLIYNLWELFEDTKDKIELALLISSFIKLLDEARETTKVTGMQRSSAKLAQAYETTFQLLIQKLGSILMDKLPKAAAKKIKEGSDRKNKMSEAQRMNLLAESATQDDVAKLDADHLEAEMETALKTRPSKPAEPDSDFDAMVVLPNSHTWKRNKKTGVWCRSSAECKTRTLDKEFIDELDAKANNLDDEFSEMGGYGVKDNIPLPETGVYRNNKPVRQTQRTQLRSRMTAPAWASGGRDWNAHHVIPWGFLNHGTFDVLRSHGGWDHNDLANSLALPTQRGIKGAEHLPVHQVSLTDLQNKGAFHDVTYHGVYSQKVKAKLDAMLDKFEHDPKKLREEVHKLIQDLKANELISSKMATLF
ncbi:DUF4157 domain-containing protein [Paradesertivirga mongoliensis]|uniref:DUF4157 domain-containing protein n=1 Tax=Paradesertivirga mongoliensis TaxID=2100740 RepID=A0ABW4ZQC1_9SPHI|nr:DUF4157 domain-containing protein [Pedobacter mongoliensis]